MFEKFKKKRKRIDIPTRETGTRPSLSRRLVRLAPERPIRSHQGTSSVYERGASINRFHSDTVADPLMTGPFVFTTVAWKRYDNKKQTNKSKARSAMTINPKVLILSSSSTKPGKIRFLNLVKTCQTQ